MIDMTFIFRSLKGRCHGSQFLGRISEIATPTFILRNVNGRINCGDKNLASFGSANLEIQR